MVLKKRSKPLKLLGLEALEKRMELDDPDYPYIRRKMLSARAGIGGEEILDRVFYNNRFQHQYEILHDLHLHANSKFQMDTVYLTPSNLVVLEMKNISGRIKFEKNPRQMIRTLESGQVDAYDCPGIQLEKNMMLLKEWILSRGLDVPVSGAVLFARSSTIFENDPPFKALFPSELPVFIRKTYQPSKEVDSGTFQLLAQELLERHVDYNPFPICDRYKIPAATVKTGVEFKQCGKLGMKKAKKGWVCTCSFVDKYAHRDAVIEWFMLIGGKLTNQECRRFLQLDNLQTATRILNEMNLTKAGRFKSQSYTMNLMEYFSEK